MIRVDQELVINVPEPELSVMWKEEQVYTEDYEAEVQYIPNDEWYTTQRVTLQEPSAGRRKVAAVIEYKNGQEVGREILKEEIYADAVPKIIERGTKIPPTYIKPISGGRLSSGLVRAVRRQRARLRTIREWTGQCPSERRWQPPMQEPWCMQAGRAAMDTQSISTTRTADRPGTDI